MVVLYRIQYIVRHIWNGMVIAKVTQTFYMLHGLPFPRQNLYRSKHCYCYQLSSHIWRLQKTDVIIRLQGARVFMMFQHSMPQQRCHEPGSKVHHVEKIKQNKYMTQNFLHY